MDNSCLIRENHVAVDCGRNASDEGILSSVRQSADRSASLIRVHLFADRGPSASEVKNLHLLE